MKKISLTEKEFRELLLLLEIGTYVKEAVDESEEMDISRARDLLDKLCAEASRFGADDLVEKFQGKFVCSDAMSEFCFENYIKKYDEDCFWEQLETRLGNRDFNLLADKEEKEEAAKDPRKIFAVLDKYSDKYKKEFERYGVARLFINKKAPVDES